MDKPIFGKKTSPYLIKKDQEMQRHPVGLVALSGLAGGIAGCFLALWLNLLAGTQISLFSMFLVSIVPGAWMGGIIHSLQDL